jgi:hypothetical protein
MAPSFCPFPLERRKLRSLSITQERRHLAGALAAAGLTACFDTAGTRSTSAAPATAAGDLIGARARDIDRVLQDCGFCNVGGHKTDSASFTIWWSAKTRQYLSVKTEQERIAAIEPIFEGNCL